MSLSHTEVVLCPSVLKKVVSTTFCKCVFRPGPELSAPLILRYMNMETLLSFLMSKMRTLLLVLLLSLKRIHMVSGIKQIEVILKKVAGVTKQSFQQWKFSPQTIDVPILKYHYPWSNLQQLFVKEFNLILYKYLN